MRPVEGADGDWVIQLVRSAFLRRAVGLVLGEVAEEEFWEIGRLGGEEEENGGNYK
jgi:hypothetical protein